MTACGSVIDTTTGLTWFVGPDKDTNWDEARSWAKGLNACGGGWKMPSQAQLKSLFHQGAAPNNLNAAYKTTGWHIWSSETDGEYNAWYYYMSSGTTYSGRRTSNGSTRAFAVRHK